MKCALGFSRQELVISFDGTRDLLLTNVGPRFSVLTGERLIFGGESAFLSKPPDDKGNCELSKVTKKCLVWIVMLGVIPPDALRGTIHKGHTAVTS